MLNSTQAAAIISEIAQSKNISPSQVTHFEVEGSNWGSVRIGKSVYTFDFTKAGKLKYNRSKPAVFFHHTLSDVLNPAAY